MQSIVTLSAKTILSFSIIGIFGCAGEEASSQASLQSLDLMKAESAAERLVSGEVVASQQRTLEGKDLYEIYVQTSNDSIVSIGIQQSNGDLATVAHTSGVPSYDFAPQSYGLLSLEAAIAEAKYITPGVVVDWGLYESNQDENTWIYDIYLLASDSSLSEVKIDAGTGQILNYSDPSWNYGNGNYGNKSYGNKNYGSWGYGTVVGGTWDYGTVVGGTWDYGYWDYGYWDYGTVVGGTWDYGYWDYGNGSYGYWYDGSWGYGYLSVDDSDDDDSDDDDSPVIPLPPTSTTTAPNPSNLIEGIHLAALGHVKGTVKEVEREYEYGFGTWKVEVVTLSGSTVDLRLMGSSLALYRAEGKTRPFDYDFAPELGLLTLKEAIAASGVKYEPLERWRLERKKGRLLWELRFYESRVEIDAYTGMVTDKD